MNREPFAVVEPRLHASENELWAIFIDGMAVGHFSRDDAKDRAFIVNAAFNKRLAEELEKARKEWERGK